jgi:hypothetical protein
MNLKNFSTVCVNPFICAGFIFWYAFGILSGYAIFRYSERIPNAEKLKAAQVEIVKNPDWSSIENLNFDLDMEKIEVTLIKRTFDDQGEEATLLEYGDKQRRYLMCSRDMHDKLVIEFQEMIKARKAEGN